MSWICELPVSSDSWAGTRAQETAVCHGQDDADARPAPTTERRTSYSSNLKATSMRECLQDTVH